MTVTLSLRPNLLGPSLASPVLEQSAQTRGRQPFGPQGPPLGHGPLVGARWPRPPHTALTEHTANPGRPLPGPLGGGAGGAVRTQDRRGCGSSQVPGVAQTPEGTGPADSPVLTPSAFQPAPHQSFWWDPWVSRQGCADPRGRGRGPGLPPHLAHSPRSAGRAP